MQNDDADAVVKIKGTLKFEALSLTKASK